MISRTRRAQRSFRLTAALAVCALLSWATPPAASADEFWGLWASEVAQRAWWEMPFVIVFSLPPMVVTTPFWATTKAVSAMGGPTESERAHANDDAEDDDE
jgi:hypothetical protein